MLERIKRSVDGLGPVTVLLLGALVGSFLTMLLVSSATGLLGGQGNVVESSGVLNTSAKSGFNETRVEVLV
ncbi:MAG: hypothetical protein SV760_05295, partial [Halobacteria archaeon]|nr:hypothetical protein [Halobacteria archaeon]